MQHMELHLAYFYFQLIPGSDRNITMSVFRASWWSKNSLMDMFLIIIIGIRILIWEDGIIILHVLRNNRDVDKIMNER